MNTRIRYIKHDINGFMKSRRYIVTSQGEASVLINLSDNSATISDGDGKEYVTESCVSLNKTKIVVKSMLVELGAVFEPEKRSHAE